MIRLRLMFGVVLAWFAGAPLDAATVSYVGIQTNVAGYRSTGVVKTFDLDGDNVYGSAGYVVYGTDIAGNTTAGSVPTADPLTYSAGDRQTLKSIPSYLTLTSNGQNQLAVSYGYKLIDNPTLTPASTVADVEGGAALRGTVTPGTEVSMLNITINSGAPATLRIGVMVNNADSYAGTVRLTQTTGGSASSGQIGYAHTSTVDILFFDLANYAVNDVFTLYLKKNSPVSGNTNTNVLYGGLVFDATAIPEPASLGVLSLGGLALLRRRR